MSTTYLKFAIAYVALVALPIVGLFGVLRAGHNVKAPVHVDGRWNLHTDHDSVLPLNCTDTDSSNFPSVLTISQSGRYISVQFSRIPGLTASGTFDGDTLHVAGSAAQPSPGCTKGSLALVGTLDPGPGTTSFTGTLSTPDCQACPRLSFRATRQLPDQSEAR
jgi:hypothetical protein